MKINKEQIYQFASILSSFVSAKVDEELSYRDSEGTWFGSSHDPKDNLIQDLCGFFNVPYHEEEE